MNRYWQEMRKPNYNGATRDPAEDGMKEEENAYLQDQQ